MHWILIFALGAFGTGCADLHTPPAASTPPAPVAAAPARPAPATPAEARYPGGTVTLRGNVLRSSGMGRASGTGPRHKLLAQRAAYLVAVRNAGLFLGGLRSDEAGRLSRHPDRQIEARLTVRNFREVSRVFDPASRTAHVTVEVDLPPTNP